MTAELWPCVPRSCVFGAARQLSFHSGLLLFWNAKGWVRRWGKAGSSRQGARNDKEQSNTLGMLDRDKKLNAESKTKIHESKIKHLE
jgi:hypothetical protein